MKDDKSTRNNLTAQLPRRRAYRVEGRVETSHLNYHLVWLSYWQLLFFRTRVVNKLHLFLHLTCSPLGQVASDSFCLFGCLWFGWVLQSRWLLSASVFVAFSDSSRNPLWKRKETVSY